MRIAPVTAAAVLLIASCSDGSDSGTPANTAGDTSPELAAQVASYDLVAGRKSRFIVGLLASDKTRLVAFGTIDMTLTFARARAGEKASSPQPLNVTAQFLPIPGQRVDPATPGPRFVEGSQGIGVYGADNVTFNGAGFWEVTVTAAINGKRLRAKAAFEVLDRSAIPAPGDVAPRTMQPLAGANAVDARSIDSRAAADVPIPDPELHTTTIAAALDARRPLMVVVSTPTYCVSRFCGPITDSVSALGKRYGDRMAFVHLEVWKNFENKELNKAAAEWIFPPGSPDAQEPWVFVVSRDGRITHRFDNVATDRELQAAVTEVTR